MYIRLYALKTGFYMSIRMEEEGEGKSLCVYMRINVCVRVGACVCVVFCLRVYYVLEKRHKIMRINTHRNYFDECSAVCVVETGVFIFRTLIPSSSNPFRHMFCT